MLSVFARVVLVMMVIQTFFFLQFHQQQKIESCNKQPPIGIEENKLSNIGNNSSTGHNIHNSTLATAGANANANVPFKFPTPRERIKYYMGSWYDIPITSKNFCNTLKIANTNTIPSDSDTLYTLALLNARLIMRGNWLSSYLREAANVLSHVESKVDQGKEISKLVVLRIGDSSSKNYDLPVVSKSRLIQTDKERRSSIVWPIRINHHFDIQLNKLNVSRDTPWYSKQEAVVWRGSCTGSSHNSSRLTFVRKYALHQNASIDIGMIGSCASGARLENKYFKDTKTIGNMLKYKYLLSLEGNDVATGLKWQLASTSVVFMPKPTVETFTMEGLLVPFVHYIPVRLDGSDLEEMVKWAKDNDNKTRWISEQATTYMNDLWFSDKAQDDNILIRNQLANIYHKQFGDVLRECYTKKN